MRQFLIAFVASLLILTSVGDPAQAQGVRPNTLMRPTVTRPMPAFQPFMPFTPFTPMNTLTRSTPGGFNPSTGAFTPSATGAYSLSRRGGFEPMTGAFTPTPTGNFTLSAREAFNSSTNTYVPSATGSFVARERGAFTPTGGSFVNTTTGTLNPLTGVFSPTTTGGTSLASRGLFVPTTGTFVPSSTGRFTASTRETFDVNTGTFVPSPTGSFRFTTRGNFVPSSVGSPSTLPLGQASAFSSFNSSNPFAATVSPFISNAWMNGVNPAFNPYSGWNSYPGYAGNPYAASNPHNAMPFNTVAASGYANPYASYLASFGSYASAPYAAPYYGGLPSYAPSQPQASIPAYTGGSQTKGQNALAAFGVPNENGAVSWPLAFRLMAPELQRDVLLDELASQLQTAATQAASDKANPGVLKDAKRNAGILREWLRSHRLDMAEGTYLEGRAFLHNIDEALKTR